ncbi:unnamed protein product [Brassica rapa]|uniref:Uncharacterized protein n=1 Tax=Brassica campestris TaxID=3711 RepID=A0A8D9M8B3_BRACM|nr:unnamed protein product [Brassica rapa]
MEVFSKIACNIITCVWKGFFLLHGFLCLCYIACEL